MTQDLSAASTPESLPTYTRRTTLYKIGQGLLRMFSILFFDLRAFGLENIPKRGGVLIVSNHASYLDPAILGVKVRRPMSFMAKSELFTNKLFGWVIRSVNAYPVRQGEGDVAAVRETIKRLQEGHILVMFPEGGRTQTGEIEPLQPGVGLIVRRAGPTVKVVPAAVDGAYEAWSRHRKVFRCRPIRVKYGPALEISDKKALEIVQIVDAEIHRLHEELKKDAVSGLGRYHRRL